MRGVGGGGGGGVRSMLLIALRCFLKDPLLALCLLDYRANKKLRGLILFFYLFIFRYYFFLENTLNFAILELKHHPTFFPFGKFLTSCL